MWWHRLSNLSTTFYWISAGHSIPVTFSYCMNNGQCSPTGQATFDVSGATVSNMTIPTGTVNVFAGPLLGYGPTGIAFNPTVTFPPGYTSGLQWVQLSTGDTLTLTPVGAGAVKMCVNVTVPPTSTGMGLDTAYPFDRGPSTHDNPSTTLDSSQYKEETRSFSATMFLMWDPALPGGCIPSSSCTSIPVPLGYVSWTWSGDANFNGGQWTLANGNHNIPSFVSSTSYPTWSVLVPFNGNLSCQ
jgi:hypothetical protein